MFYNYNFNKRIIYTIYQTIALINQIKKQIKKITINRAILGDILYNLY